MKGITTLDKTWSATLLLKRRLYQARLPIVAGIFYLIYTMVWMYPVSLHPLTLLPGNVYDTYQHLWTMWWFRYSITVLHVNPNNLTTLFAPYGHTIRLYLPSHYLTYLRSHYSPSLAQSDPYNLLLIASFPLCGLSMYALTYDRPNRIWHHLPQDFIFGFFPAKTMHIVGHYFSFISIGCHYMCYFYYARSKSPSWRNAILAGVFLGLSTLSHLIHPPPILLSLLQL